MATAVDNEVIWGIDVRVTQIVKIKTAPTPIDEEKREEGTNDYDGHLYAFHGHYLVRKFFEAKKCLSSQLNNETEQNSLLGYSTAKSSILAQQINIYLENKV